MKDTRKIAFDDWHRKAGGDPGRLAGHALRLLNEAVELCITAGARNDEIIDRVFQEINKADARGELAADRKVDPKEVRKELADVSICADVLAGHTGNVDIEPERREKLHILINDRKWEVDKDGVLWRPGMVPPMYQVPKKS